MKRRLIRWVMVMGTLSMLAAAKAAFAQLGVGVGINLGLPPPQAVVMAPGGVYFVADPGVDAFFHNGFWWTSRGNRWYRSRAYDGDWVIVERQVVPTQVVRIYQEPDYRTVYVSRGKPIPYGQWKKSGHPGKHEGIYKYKKGKHGRDD